MDDADSLGSFTGVSRPGSDYCQWHLFGVEQGGDVADSSLTQADSRL